MSPIINATTESDGSLDQLMDPGLELVRPRRMCWGSKLSIMVTAHTALGESEPVNR